MCKQKVDYFKEDKKLIEEEISKNKQAICDYEKEIESINAKLADLPEEVDMSSKYGIRQSFKKH